MNEDMCYCLNPKYKRYGLLHRKQAEIPEIELLSGDQNTFTKITVCTRLL